MDKNNERGLKALHLELVKLMQEFDLFCIENKINYSMSGGALLGTIREGGIIPWDDDLDIQFDRASYERIIPLLENYPKFSIEKDKWVYRVRLKDSKEVCGVMPTMDLFVFDNVPNVKFLKWFKQYSIAFLQGMYKKKPEYSKFSFVFKLCAFVSSCIGRIVPNKSIDKLYTSVSKIGNRHKTKYVNCYNTFFKQIFLCYPSNIINCNFIRKKFENIEVNVNEEYDANLTTLYGDYMTPPPLNEQVPMHQKQ